MFNNLANRFRRITTSHLYLSELDGIRFVLLVTVTLFHIRGYFLDRTSVIFADKVSDHFIINNYFENTDRCVPFFFSIAGFILCLPFAHQYINHGKKIDLKKYYLRRVTRLEPPYFIAMIGIFIAQLIMGVNSFHVIFPSLLASLIYSHNIIYHHTPLLTVVAWSMEVEIQYYIIAPLLFKLLTLSAKWRRSIISIIMVAIILVQHMYPLPFRSIYDSLQHFLVGILIADLYVSGFAIEFFKKKWMAIVALVLFLTEFYMPIPRAVAGKHHHPMGTDVLLAIAFPFLTGILYYIILRNDICKKVLSYKFVPLIGGMCYTTYLIHYTIISMFGRFTINLHLTNYYLPNLFLQFFLVSIPILLISSVYYLYVERPFMSNKLVDKLMNRKKKYEETNMPAEIES